MKNMKKRIAPPFFLFVSFMTLAAFSATAQNDKELLKKADRMIAQRQYLSAYQLLDEADPSNDRAAMMLKKEHIVLNYFSQSIMHRCFSLADLQEDESLDSLRANFSMGNIFTFDADSLTIRLLANNPDNKELLDGHALYHQAILDDYDYDVWTNSLDSLCFNLLGKACDKGSHSAASQLGNYYTYFDDYPSAIPYFQRAIALCDTAWGDHYNLGILQYYGEQHSDAVTHLLRAFDGYKAPSLKADAARILGLIYDENLNEPKEALKYLQLAVDINSSDFYNHAFLLKYRLSHKELSLAESTLATAWSLAIDGNEPFNACNFLMSACSEYNYTAPLIDLLKKSLTRTNDHFALGISELYLGQLLENNDDAVTHLRNAITHFQHEEAPDSFLDSLRQLIDERSGK